MLTPLEVRQGRVIYQSIVFDRFLCRASKDNIRRGETITKARLASVPTVFGLQPGDVETSESMADGDKRAIFIIRYDKPKWRYIWDPRDIENSNTPFMDRS
jgi:hypothetical protein